MLVRLSALSVVAYAAASLAISADAQDLNGAVPLEPAIVQCLQSPSADCLFTAAFVRYNAAAAAGMPFSAAARLMGDLALELAKGRRPATALEVLAQGQAGGLQYLLGRLLAEGELAAASSVAVPIVAALREAAAPASELDQAYTAAAVGNVAAALPFLQRMAAAGRLDDYCRLLPALAASAVGAARSSEFLELVGAAGSADCRVPAQSAMARALGASDAATAGTLRAAAIAGIDGLDLGNGLQRLIALKLTIEVARDLAVAGRIDEAAALVARIGRGCLDALAPAGSTDAAPRYDRQEVLHYLALAQATAGATDEAVRLLAELEQLSGPSVALRSDLASAIAGRGERERAAELLPAALEAVDDIADLPRQIRALAALGRAYALLEGKL